MIEVTVSPAELVVGEESDLTVHLANTGIGICTQIIFTLTLPSDIMLLSGRNRIELRRLASGETVTRAFRVLPRSTGTCQVTSTNFSYRDRYGATWRIADFGANLVTIPMEVRVRAPDVHAVALEIAFAADFVTADLPYGEWSSLEGRVRNSGEAELADLEISISGPVTVDEQGRRLNLGTVRSGFSADFVFYVCADQAGGTLPLHLEVSFSAQNRRCTQRVMRTVRVTREQQSRSAEKTIILFVGANPVNAEPLRIGKEFSVIMQATREGKGGNNLDIRPCFAARVEDISRELLNLQPRIVHFAGHGGGPSESFAAEREDGTAYLIPPDGLAKLFETAGKSVECVIINACSTEGLGQALCRHVEYVIAMRHPIGDLAAIEFSRGFYQALAAYSSIKQAFGVGIAHLKMVPEGEDYEIPKLLGGSIS
jgi:hypothetical protein